MRYVLEVAEVVFVMRIVVETCSAIVGLVIASSTTFAAKWTVKSILSESGFAVNTLSCIYAVAAARPTRHTAPFF